ncbi:hypothetical protein [Bdellovibrio sp. HCB337]|uniref:hypothetical protein n=1 Tax=Bdellovibrio sp. HCB337 TaxID=3394358 RepID=UPI0039A50F09
MIQLSIEENLNFELDCCSSCFSLWLDSGEDTKIKELFQRHLAAAEIRDLTSEENEILGKIVLEHAKTMERYKRIERLGRTMSARLHPFMRFHTLQNLIDDDIV